MHLSPKMKIRAKGTKPKKLKSREHFNFKRVSKASFCCYISRYFFIYIKINVIYLILFHCLVLVKELLNPVENFCPLIVYNQTEIINPIGIYKKYKKTLMS